ncbi:hypothetical protein A1O3_03474 [Capronia epimyces CBS 606.96]|uniref:Transcription factor domain-containing protein n=1 Tax=Capronia epimyces CBS 606.96 TaxID=1182542 RepID=W9Y209_9EURO|nr:uncharacterized protein A1O3_03474 [Capronia epimyces CBS 606.96]EXJ86523.1 hypothetical protein A1O3_03474 [Capronia epimyces CBS 606.96]
MPQTQDQMYGYEANFTWLQDAAQAKLPLIAYRLPESSTPNIEDWMFLNTSVKDVESSATPGILLQEFVADQASVSSSPASHSVVMPARTRGFEFRSHHPAPPSSVMSMSDDHASWNLDTLARQMHSPDPVCRSLSDTPIRYSQKYLLDYFRRSIGPQCHLAHNDNPYVRLILPIALSAPSGPLMQALLCASANQLRLLSDRRFEKEAWMYRAKTLGLVRSELDNFMTGLSRDTTSFEQLLASVVMLCFVEISNDAADTWMVHSACAQVLLSSDHRYSARSAELDDLCDFVHLYFAAHDALARTSWIDPRKQDWRLPVSDDHNHINGLTGCSKELLNLIMATTNLANAISDAERHPREGSNRNAEHAFYDTGQRDGIERRLHQIEQWLPSKYLSQSESCPSPTSSLSPFSEPNRLHRLEIIAEVKRLAALIYFYARIDRATPEHPQIIRLTASMLNLLRKVPVSANALLWPLYIVGTLGVQSCQDEHRALVLERLEALEKRRQLRNVKDVRQVVVDVWKQRDLQTLSSRELCWSDIAICHGKRISLA